MFVWMSFGLTDVQSAPRQATEGWSRCAAERACSASPVLLLWASSPLLLLWNRKLKRPACNALPSTLLLTTAVADQPVAAKPVLLLANPGHLRPRRNAMCRSHAASGTCTWPTLCACTVTSNWRTCCWQVGCCLTCLLFDPGRLLILLYARLLQLLHFSNCCCCLGLGAASASLA